MPRHDYHHPAPPACCSCCCGCAGAGAAPCYYPAPAPAPPSSTASDQLLHAIAAHLLLSSPVPAQPQSQPQPQPPPPPAAQHATNPHPYPYPYPQQYQYQYQQQEPKHHTYIHPPLPQLRPNPSGDNGHLLLHSLLRRVAAIESALPHCFPAPPPARRPPHPNHRPRRAARYHEEEQEVEEDGSEPESPPSPPPPRPRPRPRRSACAGPPSAASDRAARTIQAHFRRFLALRSRTLRQLKELAVLRSKAAAIRGSLSGRRSGADPAAVSEAAMGLLLRLDAIQVMEVGTLAMETRSGLYVCHRCAGF